MCFRMQQHIQVCSTWIFYVTSIDFWHVWMLQVFRALQFTCCVWFIWHHLATFILLESHVKRSILAIPQPTIEFISATEPSGMFVFLLNPFLLAHLKKHPPSCTTTSFTLITDDTSFIWDSDVWWQSKLCGRKRTGPFVFFSTDWSSEQSWWRELEIYFKTIQTERKPCFFAIICVINDVGWWMFQWTVWLQNRKFGR